MFSVQLENRKPRALYTPDMIELSESPPGLSQLAFRVEFGKHSAVMSEYTEPYMSQATLPLNATESTPMPDGGTTAWLQVLAAHLALFNSWGYINSFGIFQVYYTQSLNKSPSIISWVGSMEIFLVCFVGMFSGRAMDAGYFRTTIIIGLLAQLIGVFATSLCTQYWQLFLAQGICQGLGDGLVFCPMTALLSTYFSKKNALAIALEASGAATGGMVFPAIAQSLLARIGFGWTVRVMGFVMLFNAAIIIALARERKDLPRKAGGPLFDWTAFREPPYAFFTAATFLILWGVYYAYYYVRPYARDVLGVDEHTSFSILLLINGIGIPGRVVPALLSDHFFGPINTFIPFATLGGVLMFCWISVSSLPAMWAFVAVFGFFGAGVQSLFATALGSLTTDMSKIGVRVGMVLSIVSFACLSGPPLAGSFIEARNGNYLGAQLFGGIVFLGGAALLFAARTARYGFVLNRRM